MKTLICLILVLSCCLGYSQPRPSFGGVLREVSIPVGPSASTTVQVNEPPVLKINDVMTEYPEYIEGDFVDELKKAVNCLDTKKPLSISELTDGWDWQTYSLTSSAAQFLNILSVAQAELAVNKDIRVFDYMFHKSETDCAGNKIKWGAGVRLVITIDKLEGKGSISLAAIAATGELKQASITTDMQVIGLSGEKIAAIKPSAGDFNIDRYNEYMAAIDKVKTLAYDKDVTVAPVKIQVEVKNDFFYSQSILNYHAIYSISRKRSYEASVLQLKSPSEQSKNLLRLVYIDLIKRADNSTITDLEAAQAKQKLVLADIFDN